MSCRPFVCYLHIIFEEIGIKNCIICYCVPVCGILFIQLCSIHTANVRAIMCVQQFSTLLFIVFDCLPESANEYADCLCHICELSTAFFKYKDFICFSNLSFPVVINDLIFTFFATYCMIFQFLSLFFNKIPFPSFLPHYFLLFILIGITKDWDTTHQL